MQLLTQRPEVSVDFHSDAMSARHMGHLFALAYLHDPERTLRLLSHGASVTAQEKQRLLPGGVHVQKSITLHLGNHFLLVSGVGDFHLTGEDYQALARILGLSRTDARRREINPAWFPARVASGLAPGMVSPFFPPGFIAAWPYTAIVLKGLVLSSAARAVQNRELAAISLSLGDSLLFPVGGLRELIVAYNLLYHPTIPVIDLPVSSHSYLNGGGY